MCVLLKWKVAGLRLMMNLVKYLEGGRNWLPIWLKTAFILLDFFMNWVKRGIVLRSLRLIGFSLRSMWWRGINRHITNPKTPSGPAVVAAKTTQSGKYAKTAARSVQASKAGRVNPAPSSTTSTHTYARPAVHQSLPPYQGVPNVPS